MIRWNRPSAPQTETDASNAKESIAIHPMFAPILSPLVFFVSLIFVGNCVIGTRRTLR